MFEEEQGAIFKKVAFFTNNLEGWLSGLWRQS